MNTWLENYHTETDLNRYPIALRTEGGIGYKKPNGEIVSAFVGHPVHYEENRQMKPITLDWIPSTGEFEGSWFGWDAIKKCPTYCGYELYTPKAVIWNGIAYPLNFLRLENRMIADIPIGTYEIIYTEKGMSEIVTIPEPVEGTLEFDAPEQDGWDEYLYRTERKIIDGSQSGSTYNLTKDMDYPLVIDPDYASDVGDGYITGTSSSYSTARATSTSHDISSTRIYLDNSWIGGITYYVRRGVMRFDTSGIPDTDTITSVSASLWLGYKTVTSHYDVQIVKYNWSAYSPITSGNRETVFDGILAASLDAVWKNTNDITKYTRYSSSALDTAWVSKTGYTYYGLRTSTDASASAPSHENEVGIATQEDATPSNRPYLIVTHSVPSTGGMLAWY